MVNGQGKTTLRDVAELSGLSITTVSHVLNDVPGKRIPETTRDRVRAAAQRLSYRPNLLAQGLRTQRSNTLGFLSDRIATSPHAGLTILGAQDAAADHGSLLLFMNSGTDPDLEERELRALLDRQVDGIIYAAEFHRVVVPPAGLRQAPSVLLDARAVNGDLISVVPDEVGGARTAVDELVGFGHRDIGFITNIDDIPATAGRLEGFTLALAAAGLAFQPSLVVADVSETAGGYRAASVLLDRAAPPTALFCFNDRMAMGAYQAAAEHGLVVPHDLSIIGFDNQEIISAGLRPGLTTVALPHYQMGRWAVNALMGMIDSSGTEPGVDGDTPPQVGGLGPPMHTVLPCPIVRRGSVARPRDPDRPH